MNTNGLATLTPEVGQGLRTIETHEPSIISIIAQVVGTPNFDVTTMERLFALQEKYEKKQEIKAFNTARAKLQLPIIGKRANVGDSNSKVSYKYALYEDVIAGITPTLSEHGFSISFRMEPTDKAGYFRCIGRLSHEGGHSEETDTIVPLDNGPGRNAIQQVASTMSYAKRQLVGMLLNVVMGGEDDDGRSSDKTHATTASHANPTPLVEKSSVTFDRLGINCKAEDNEYNGKVTKQYKVSGKSEPLGTILPKEFLAEYIRSKEDPKDNGKGNWLGVGVAAFREDSLKRFVQALQAAYPPQQSASTASASPMTHKAAQDLVQGNVPLDGMSEAEYAALKAEAIEAFQ